MRTLLLFFTLWSATYLDSSDGVAVSRNLGKCPMNGYKTTVFDCTNKCNIKRVRAFFKSKGDLYMIGRTGPIAAKRLGCGKSCFCIGKVKRGKSKTCVKRRNYEINDRSINFVLKCKKAATNVRIFVNGNVKIPPRQKPTTKNLGHCVKGGQYKTAVFECDGNCEIKSATARYVSGGDVDMVGRDGNRVFTPLLCGRKCFCRGFTNKASFEKCVKKKGFIMRKGRVSFVLKCNKLTRNVKIIVRGNIKAPTTTPKVEGLDIGFMTKTERKFYKVRCKGTCNLEYFRATFKHGGNIDLIGSQLSPKRFLTNCANGCICGGENFFQTYEVCKKLSYHEDINSDTIYFMVGALEDSHNVIVNYRVSNLLDISPFSPVCDCTEDGMSGACDSDEGRCSCNPGFVIDDLSCVNHG